MGNVRATHKVTLHTPQAAGLQSIFALHIDRTHIRHQRVGFHVHTFSRTGDIDFHHRVALMHKVLFRKCIFVRIWVRVDNEVLVSGSRIRTCPEEIFSLFGCGQFTGNPYVTVEHTLYFRRNIVIMLVLQH